MGSTRTRRTQLAVVAILVALACATSLLGGCFWRKPQPPAAPTPVSTPPTPSAEVTSPAPLPEPPSAVETAPVPPADVDAKTGPLHVPQPGSAERQALADAARARLKTSSRFVVNQMQSNSAWAIAQLTAVGTSASHFVGFRHSPKGWTAFWDAAPSSASAKSLLAADPRISAEVVNAIDWKGVKEPAAEPKPGRPSNKEVSDVAKTFVTKANPGTEVTGTEVLGLTKDAKGHWWAWVVVRGQKNVDPLTVYIYKDVDWKLWDYGTDPKPVPKDVKF